jgi:ABC-type uncharacterized transport system permease subunit
MDVLLEVAVGAFAAAAAAHYCRCRCHRLLIAAATIIVPSCIMVLCTAGGLLAATKSKSHTGGWHHVLQLLPLIAGLSLLQVTFASHLQQVSPGTHELHRDDCQ